MQTFICDPMADAIYVQLNKHPVAITKELDDSRIIDYDETGQPTGVEFLFVSQGINLTHVPEARRIAAALTDAGFAIAA